MVPAASEPSNPVVEEPTVAWAVGVLMALTPCTAPTARRILAVAASTAGITVREVAGALAEYSRGVPVPRRVERALRMAVRASRTPADELPGGLLPGRSRAEEVLGRFRACRDRVRATPGDADARQALDDVAYTLCVLMGRRNPHQAVRAAEEYLVTTPGPEEPEGSQAAPRSAGHGP
ncbi:DUF5133 domain-containing protein [Streptomyces sp. NPDC060028]|uniref:DUF5133 domain-containing protein n=1 Tax=Streptomyces sp. NPDC060028 TaxID=3347041 RepID=UPI00367C899E